jgi:hypothetical protein
MHPSEGLYDYSMPPLQFSSIHCGTGLPRACAVIHSQEGSWFTH